MLPIALIILFRNCTIQLTIKYSNIQKIKSKVIYNKIPNAK